MTKAKAKTMSTTETTRTADFRRGAVAAAAVAETYNASTTHPYRIDDCILGKLNLRGRRPRRNRQRQRPEAEAWLAGFAVALAEVCRYGADRAAVRTAARGAGLTRALARAAGVDVFDLRALKGAGVP